MNFDFIKPYPKLKVLYRHCQDAEELAVDYPAPSCASARNAIEFLVNFIYGAAVGEAPYKMTIYQKMKSPAFVKYLSDEQILGEMHSVRKMGNNGSHGHMLTAEEACDTLERLQYIVGDLCVSMGLIDDYPEFVSPLEIKKMQAQKAAESAETAATPATAKAAKAAVPVKPAAVDKLAQNPAPQTSPQDKAAEAKAVEEAVAEYAETLRRTRFSTHKQRDERENKRLFVRASLREADWKIAKVANQVMPETACINMELSDNAIADFVLYGRDSRPLAVIDYSSAMESPVAGRMAAVHAADQVEQKYGYRPTAYYVTGYRIVCIDPLGYKPRRVFGFHSLDELDVLKKRVDSRLSITNPVIDDNITNRDYQKKAIKAVCDVYEDYRRRALVVMATGTGKTRVAISLVDVLTKANWAKNVLFLADRVSLVRQAHKSFNKLLPNLTTSIFTGSSTNRDKTARLVFSTYQTMISLVDGDTREFGIGRFDLIIVDEAHRSLFSKYARLFDYFDALMVGLTATPRCEEARSTYAVFQIESGIPDFTYELEEAIQDGYLVGFSVQDKTTEKMRRGIRYDDLSDEEKAQIEEEFKSPDEDDGSSDILAAGMADPRLINRGTIDVMLSDLMDNGLKIDAGDKLGKTIIFTKSHREAEVVVEEFNKLYPNFGKDFCKLIDSSVEGAQTLIDGLSERDKMPQVAVSVDMLDTGVDVPDAVNLKFDVRQQIEKLVLKACEEGRMVRGMEDGSRFDAGGVPPMRKRLHQALVS